MKRQGRRASSLRQVKRKMGFKELRKWDIVGVSKPEEPPWYM